MEPDMAVKMITKNAALKSLNCHVGTVIGDDDSSMIANVRRESTMPIEKWSDISHAKKNFSNSLYSLKLPDKVIAYLLRCFAYALKQNQGNPEKLKGAFLNIPNHAFGNHDDCDTYGAWCKFSENPTAYKHDGLPGKKPLSGLELKSNLTRLLQKFANNAEKLAPLGSSQANEIFNNTVATKHPKSKHFAGSASLDFMVAAAVSQKNAGRQYVLKVNETLDLSPGEIAAKYRATQDKARKVRADHQHSKDFKGRRLFLKQQRNQKTASQERREGVIYQSGCGLEGIAELVDDPAVPESIPKKDSPYVLVDLETTGVNKLSAEICQIAAKCGEAEFNKYIVPTRGIPAQVSAVTGMTAHVGILTLDVAAVQATPPRLALSEFTWFLKSLGVKVHLVAHNGWKFDFPIILSYMRCFNFLEDFLSVTDGLLDTLALFRSKFPERAKTERKYSLGVLADDFGVPVIQAHNAIGDVRMLHGLIAAAGFTSDDLFSVTKPVSSSSEMKLISRKNPSTKPP